MIISKADIIEASGKCLQEEVWRGVDLEDSLRIEDKNCFLGFWSRLIDRFSIWNMLCFKCQKFEFLKCIEAHLID